MSNEKNWPDKIYLVTESEEDDELPDYSEMQRANDGVVWSPDKIFGKDVEYTRTDLLAEQDKQILEALETNLLWAEVEQDRDQIEAAIKILQERVKCGQ